MFWLWLAYFLYCVPVAPVWCFVYTSRTGHGRLNRWIVASVAAVLWLPFMIQFRYWQRHQPVTTWVDDLERELHAVEG